MVAYPRVRWTGLSALFLVLCTYNVEASRNHEMEQYSHSQRQAQLQTLFAQGPDNALGDVRLGPGESMTDFADTGKIVQSGNMIGPSWVLGTYDSTRAPAITSHRIGRLQKLQEDVGTGQPFFSDLQNAGGLREGHSMGGGMRNGKLPDPFPSFKAWMSSHHSKMGNPPSTFDMISQENGPDSQPVSTSRLYTSPDAALIHSAAVAAGAAFEDGDPAAR